MGYDGKIVFCTKIDNTNVEKDLKQLGQKIRKAEATIYKNENAKLPLVNQANVLGAQLDAAKARAEELRNEMAAINNAMAPGSDPDDYTRASADLPRIKEALAAQEKEVAALQKQWDGVNNKIDAYDIKINSAKRTIVDATARSTELGAQMNSSGQNIQNAFAKARESAANFGKQIMRVASRMILFRVFSYVLQAISGYMSKILKTNEEYTVQLAQLKAALATAFQPIYEFILPGLIAVLKVLTSIVMVVANVLSFLFGKTADQSAKNAEELNKEADAIENVGNAAKDASKSLANFDEINTLSTGGSSGGGGGTTGSQYDFEEFDTAEYKAKIDELTVYLSGALLAIGAILAFSGANIPLGIALMAAGALGLVAVVKQNWGKMSNELKDSLATVTLLVSGALLVLGAVLAFSGVNIPLGIALMAAGAVGLVTAVALNWDGIKRELQGPIGKVLALVCGALLVVGAILTFSGVNIPLGIALMAEGAVGLVTVTALNWDSIKTALQGPIGKVLALVSGSLLVIGAILTFSGVNILLGIALMAAGAAGLVTVTALNWDSIKTALQGPVGDVVTLVSGASLALGAILAFTGVNIPLGIALMAEGAVGLITVATLDWESFKTMLKDWLYNAAEFISEAQLVLGAILAFSGVNIPLGIGLMMSGAEGLVLLKHVNWNAIKEKLQGSWDGIVQWFKQTVAPNLTLQYWQDKMANVGEGIKTAFKNGINGSITLFNQFISWINKNMNFSWGDKYLLGEKIISAGSIQLITIPQIPYLAQGAVLPPNKPFMAMVGDQKSGTNIEAPLTTIQEALANVLSQQGARNINITFTGDLAQLARVLKPVIDKENNRVGGSLAKGVV